MIGTTGAAVVVCFTLLFVCVTGLLLGFAACLLAHKAWTIEVGLTDSATAVAVALLSGIIVSQYDYAHGEWPSSRDGLFVVLGIAAVPVKHAVQALFRSHDST